MTSGSKTWAEGQEEIHLHPSGLDKPPGFPPKGSGFHGNLGTAGKEQLWRHTSHPFPPAPPTLTSSFQGRRGGRAQGSHWDSQETLTWTETSARPTSFSAQHVTFFLLRSLVTLARVSLRDVRFPDCCVRKKRGKSRRASAGFWLEVGGSSGCLQGPPPAPDGKDRGLIGRGEREGWEGILQRTGLLR